MIHILYNLIRFSKNILIKNLDIVLIFLISFFVLLPVTNNACNLADNAGFDGQNLLTWSYLNDLKTMPIKDTFYPYGFFVLCYKLSTIYITNIFISQTNILCNSISIFQKTL